MDICGGGSFFDVLNSFFKIPPFFEKPISGSSTAVFDRIQYKAENEGLYRQHGAINTRYEAVLEELKQANSNVAAGEEFLRYFTEMSGPIKKFNEMYWDRLLDKMIVAERKKLTAVLIGECSVKI